jgi:hypothetical protein
MNASAMKKKDDEMSASWMVQLMRITAFPVAGVPVGDPSTWWETTIGTSPDSVTNKPKEGLVQLSGRLDDFAQLALNCQPDRIDWQISPIEPTDFSPDYPEIGVFETILPKFLEFINRWLDQQFPEFQRLAFGVILVKQVNDRVTGYHKIAEFLPNIKIDAEGSTDFTYSINRPRTSKLGIEGLKINRLSNWSVGVIKLFRIPVATPGGSKAFMNVADKETYLCRLELDVNTAVDVANLPRERIKDILTELVHLAMEIAKSGDVK